METNLNNDVIILESETLASYEKKAITLLESGQNEHNIEDIRRAKIMLDCIRWIKENDISIKNEI